MREYFCANPDLLSQLWNDLVGADLSSPREAPLRETILKIAFRLHQYKPDQVGPDLIRVLDGHKAALQTAIAAPANSELCEQLSEELATVDEVLVAPTKPFVRNFEQETETEVVNTKKPIHGLALTQ